MRLTNPSKAALVCFVVALILLLIAASGTASWKGWSLEDLGLAAAVLGLAIETPA